MPEFVQNDQIDQPAGLQDLQTAWEFVCRDGCAHHFENALENQHHTSMIMPDIHAVHRVALQNFDTVLSLLGMAMHHRLSGEGDDSDTHMIVLTCSLLAWL